MVIIHETPLISNFQTIKMLQEEIVSVFVVQPMNIKFQTHFMVCLHLKWVCLFTGCYACYVKYDEMKSAAEGGATAVANRMKMSRDSLIDLDIKQEIDDILAMKDTWLVFLIISAVALVIVLLLVLFLRKRIRIAIALIKEASK